MTEQELLDLIEVSGIGLAPFLAAVDRLEAKAIRYLAASGTDDASASLSRAQAETADATADGWDAIDQAEKDAVDDPDQH